MQDARCRMQDGKGRNAIAVLREKQLVLFNEGRLFSVQRNGER